jgi:hypothetical protein
MAFEDLFFESGGRSVQYKGRTVAMVDYFPVPEDGRVQIVFDDVNSEWRQGVMLTVDGTFRVAGDEVVRSLVLWQDSAPPKVDIGVYTKDSAIEVRNVWDTGDGVVHSWHNGGALIVEPDGQGRRYLCNDGHPDDDFTDLVFRLLPIP